VSEISFAFIVYRILKYTEKIHPITLFLKITKSVIRLISQSPNTKGLIKSLITITIEGTAIRKIKMTRIIRNKLGILVKV
jgi:hypothetical protein